MKFLMNLFLIVFGLVALVLLGPLILALAVVIIALMFKAIILVMVLSAGAFVLLLLAAPLILAAEALEARNETYTQTRERMEGNRSEEEHSGYVPNGNPS